VGVDAAAANRSHHVFKNDTQFVCQKACKPLASFEWLANKQQWATKTGPIKAGKRIYLATDKSWLKKSTATSGDLPATCCGFLK